MNYSEQKIVKKQVGKVNAELINTHLLGIYVFCTFATLPANIYLTKYFGEVPIKLSGILLGALTLILFIRGANRKVHLIPFVVILLLGYLTALFSRLDLISVFIESIPVWEFVGALFVFSSLRSARSTRVLVGYLITCLWISVLVEIGMVSGLIENPFVTRASFSGSAISDIGLGRTITPTHLLAGISIGIVLHLWISGKAKTAVCLAILTPALVIASLASTRLLLALVIVPAISALVYKSNRDRRLRFIKLGVVLGIASYVTFLLAETVLPQISVVISYASNFAARIWLGVLTGNVAELDASSYYRTLETFYANQYISSHPFFGGGFSSTYISSPIVADSSFLGLHGNSYAHNTYVWILLKCGSIGLISFFLGILMVLQFKRTSTSSYESQLFTSMVLALVPIGFVWNILANSPDSTVLGAVLGLIIASRTRSEYETALPANTHRKQVKH